MLIISQVPLKSHLNRYAIVTVEVDQIDIGHQDAMISIFKTKKVLFHHSTINMTLILQRVCDLAVWRSGLIRVSRYDLYYSLSLNEAMN